jgi:hypothetical protein
MHNMYDLGSKCSKCFFNLTHSCKLCVKNAKFGRINQHATCNPWKMIFTLAHMAPFIVFTPFMKNI